MAYELSFSEDFFCDDDPCLIEASEKPTCLYQEILQLQKENLADFRHAVEEAKLVNSNMSDEILQRAEMLPWDLMDYARNRVNACYDLSSPVTVYLTKDFYVSVEVYEK